MDTVAQRAATIYNERSCSQAECHAHPRKFDSAGVLMWRYAWTSWTGSRDHAHATSSSGLLQIRSTGV